MFSNKIILLALFATLPVAPHVLANDMQPDSQILIERAHYWGRLGRVDMAYEVWQALLRLEPDNKEALAEVAKYKAALEAKPTGASDAGATHPDTVSAIHVQPPAAAEVAPVQAAQADEATPVAVPATSLSPEVKAIATPPEAPPAQAAPDVTHAPVAAHETAADQVSETPLAPETAPETETAVQDAGAMPEKSSGTTAPAVSATETAGTSEVTAPVQVSEMPATSDQVVEAATASEAMKAPEAAAQPVVAPEASAVAETAATEVPIAAEAAAPESSSAAEAPEAVTAPAPTTEALPTVTSETPAVPEKTAATEAVAPEASTTVESPTVTEALKAPEVAVQPAVAPETSIAAEVIATEVTAAAEAPVPESSSAAEAKAPETVTTPAPTTETVPSVASETPVVPEKAAIAETPAPEASSTVASPLVTESVKAPEAAVQPAAAPETSAVVETAATKAPTAAEAAAPESSSVAEATAAAEAVKAPEAAAAVVGTAGETASSVAPVATERAAASVPQASVQAVAAPQAPAVPSAIAASSTTASDAAVQAPDTSAQVVPLNETAPVMPSAIAAEATAPVMPVSSAVVAMPEAVPMPAASYPGKLPEKKTILVEDWADLYGDNASFGPGGLNTTIDSGVAQHEVDLNQQPVSEKELADERISHSMLAEPSVSAVIENSMPDNQAKVAGPVSPPAGSAPVADSPISLPAPASAITPEPALVAVPAVMPEPLPAPAPVSATAVTPEPAPKAVPAPLPVHVLADTREKIGQYQKPSDRLPPGMNAISSKEELQAISGSSKAEPDSGPGGAIVVNKQPSRQELIERAAYWDSRGRSDLAAKVRSQLHEVAVPVSRTASTDSRPIASVQPVVIQSKPETEDKAQYWQARGRDDLAAKMSTRPVGVQTESSVATISSGRTAPAFGSTQMVSAGDRNGYATQSVAKPTRQELSDKAQYWESRGRGDLAAQIRQKLQTMEGRPDVTSRDTGVRTVRDDAARSALEDSLLRNPNSMKTRLDLAQVYRAAGELSKARVQVDSVLVDSPDLPDALFASAQLYADQRLWWETLNTLEKISPVARTAEMARLQKTGWAHMQIDRADSLVRQGKNQEAELLLREVAVELAVNYNQSALPEPPPLWKSAGTHAGNSEASMRKKGRH